MKQLFTRDQMTQKLTIDYFPIVSHISPRNQKCKTIQQFKGEN